MDEREERLALLRTDGVIQANKILDRHASAFPTLSPSHKAFCCALDALMVLRRDEEYSALVKHWYSREGVLR